MKKIKIIFTSFVCMVCCAFTVKAASPSIIGKWYGLKDGSPVTVVFIDGQSMSIKDEAFSSLSFTCHYKIDLKASPVTIDLFDIPGGMVCSGIMKFSDQGTMELFGFFGAPGQTQRPGNIDTRPKRVDALYLKLSRDSKIFAKTGIIAPPSKAGRLAFKRNKRLGRGINLNGLLDNNSGDKPIKPEYIKMIAEAGFNSVRLPITWSVHSLKSAPYTIDPAFFNRVDSIVNLCLQNGLAVSIDIHYYPYINMDADSTISFDDNIKRYYLLWAQIAKHYKNFPPEVYFDLLNEPNLEMGAKLWNELIAKSVKLIRETNPARTILVGTPNLAQSWTIGLLELPADDWNLIVQIHYYLPHLFTHQGLAYARAESSIGMKWNVTPEEKKPIESDLKYCAKWGKAHFRPINLGEFGVNENADMASRARYITFVRELADKNDFSYHVWGFREIFRVFDESNGKWHRPVLDALIPAKH
jgi:endoglucanase